MRSKMQWQLNMLILLLSLGIIAVSGCSKKRFERGYVFQEPEANIYDVSKEVSINGTVIDHIGLIYDREIPVSMLRIKTDTNQEYLVQVAPNWYLKTQYFSTKTGDKVNIIGCPVGIKEMSPDNAHDQQVEEDLITMLARVIQTTQRGIKKTFTLRDEEGRPLWYGKGRTIGKQKYIDQIIKEGKPLPGEVKRPGNAPYM